jgi:hypothetical protein
MARYNLRFRQVHLDFHTSPHIPGIGEKFDKKQWQDALKAGHVNSITCFSKCHHGWSYHPTKVGKIHPHLSFDLLRAQFDACKEIDVNVPIYLSAGVDNIMAEEHPEWREIGIGGNYIGWSGPINQPGFKMMCFNTPYLDFLCEQIREAVRLFPNCNGIFLDIIHQGECCCPYCLKYMEDHDLDADKPEDRRACAKAALERYFIETTAASRCDDPNMPVFHNSGHITKGNRDILKYFSHLELESLPTGGWGYDHFPSSAKYAEQTGYDVLGMTGKFHTTWGEFGGFKHPNALRYECAAMLAYGSKCSVGDQLHPNGEMDRSTYEIIGAAYAEVEQKEKWCDNVRSVSDIGLLSSEAETGNRDPDTGAGRILLEGHFLFDIIDRQCDFDKYKMLVLPDIITVDAELKSRIDTYLANGGKLFLTGKSGLTEDGNGFAFDIGATYHGESPFQPDYIEMGGLAPEFLHSPQVMYMRSQQVKATSGEVLARIREPYFNRTWKHFCSHQHAPHAALSEYAGAVREGNILYLAHPIFTMYYAMGSVAYKDYTINALRALLGDDESISTNLPSTARVSLMEQPDDNRYVLHLLYANTISRGAQANLSAEGYVRDSNRIEVIEDLLPLHNTEVTLTLPKTIKSVTLEPQGKSLPFDSTNGTIKLKIDEFTCHQMVVLDY